MATTARRAALGLFLAWFVLAVLALTPGGVSAAGMIPTGTALDEPIAVDVAGIVFCKIKFGYGPYEPYERLHLIEQRLYNAIDDFQIKGELAGLPEAVSIRPVGLDVGIFLGDALIVTVDVFHARLNNTTVDQLAAEWADNLKRGLQAYVEVQTK